MDGHDAAGPAGKVQGPRILAEMITHTIFLLLFVLMDFPLRTVAGRSHRDFVMEPLRGFSLFVPPNSSTWPPSNIAKAVLSRTASSSMPKLMPTSSSFHTDYKPTRSACSIASRQSERSHKVLSSSSSQSNLDETPCISDTLSTNQTDPNNHPNQKSNKNNGTSDNYTTSLYPTDENGRPIDIRGNKLLLVPTTTARKVANGDEIDRGMNIMFNLQTPHSGRKFRPTHPNSSSFSSNGQSRFGSRLRAFTRLWKRRKHVATIAATDTATQTKRSSIIDANKIKPQMRKYRKNNLRFTEGWYYRLTLPPPINESFVFIFSIEDAGRWVRQDRLGGYETGISSSRRIEKWPKRLLRSLRPNYVKSPLTLACMQLLGPRDTYLVQSDEDDTKFWGWKYAQGLGCTFEWKNISSNGVDGNSLDAADNEEISTEDIAAMTPEEWRERVQSGFQVLPFHIQVSFEISKSGCFN